LPENYSVAEIAIAAIQSKIFAKQDLASPDKRLDYFEGIIKLLHVMKASGLHWLCRKRRSGK